MRVEFKTGELGLILNNFQHHLWKEYARKVREKDDNYNYILLFSPDLN
jgi:hypothetical protein